MTNVFVVTPTEMNVERELLDKMGRALRECYGVTGELLYRQDERNNDPNFLADYLAYDPTSAIIFAVGGEAMPFCDKVAMETEIVPMLREYSDHTSFEILATYILPLLQKSMAKKDGTE